MESPRFYSVTFINYRVEKEGNLTFVLLLSARALASYKETWLDTYVQQERQPGKRGQMVGSADTCIPTRT